MHFQAWQQNSCVIVYVPLPYPVMVALKELQDGRATSENKPGSAYYIYYILYIYYII